jgi:hypothetical protein
MRPPRRRELLVAASSTVLGARVFGAATVAPEPRLALRARSGVTVRAVGSRSGPMLELVLPGRQTASAVVELPEHAWGRRTASSEQIWFYSLYGKERARATAAWRLDGESLTYTMETPLVRMTARAAFQGARLDIAYTISNPSQESYAAVMATTCVKLFRPFTDVFLERTFVRQGNRLALIAADTPERLDMNAEQWLPCRYIARTSGPPLDQGARVRREEGVTKYTTRQFIDAPFLVTTSSPAGWTAATFARDAESVFTNPARTCHHADVIRPLPAGTSVQLSSHVVISPGSPASAWAQAAPLLGRG